MPHLLAKSLSGERRRNIENGWPLMKSYIERSEYRHRKYNRKAKTLAKTHGAAPGWHKGNRNGTYNVSKIW